MLAIVGLDGAISSAAADTAPGNRWEKLRTQDLRVATVTYRLSIANRRDCGSALALQPGFVLHGIEQYGAADRLEAAHNFGLGRHLGILAVVAGSPAESAGLAADDQLAFLNGRALATAGASGSPTRKRVEQVQSMIVEELQKGAVTLGVFRAGARVDVTFTASSGCPSDVELVPGEDVNAWADGKRVVVSSGILDWCRTDDDLALVIAHEMAHNLLHHSERLASAGKPGGDRLGLIGAKHAEMRETEEEADGLAVRLVSTAAYDLGNAEPFLSGLLSGADSPRAAATHPDRRRRLALLRAAVLKMGDAARR